MSLGLLSAGIGEVPASQTYVDMSQGARIFPSLYDDPIPALAVEPAGPRAQRVQPAEWSGVRERAADAPANLVPGLLGSRLRGAGVAVGADPRSGAAATMAMNERGIVSLPPPGCAAGDGRETSRIAPKFDHRGPSCAGLSVIASNSRALPALARSLRGHDLLIAIEAPPPPKDHQLAMGIAGAGFDGARLTSDSTRMDGYVLSTDLAPTVLERLGIAVPSPMTGQPIEADGTVDAADLERLDDRLAAIGPRRGPVIGVNMLIWIGLAAIAGLALGARGLRTALPLLAMTVAYVPAVLLVTAAIEPSLLAERLVVGLASPALALLTWLLVADWGGLAIAALVSVAVYAVDVVAGSGLTELSLVGPNPALGVRFYGIGNELEATVAALIPLGTGAALLAWAPRVSPRVAAITFCATALVAVAAFAPGRFGADVGAAIGIPVGAAVAVVVCLGGTRWRLLAVIVVPLLALGALVVIDLVLGGDAHLTRSVLRAGGLDHLGQVAERRVRLSGASFSRYGSTPVLWIVLAAIAAGIWQRSRVQGWFDGGSAWAGFLGACAATVAGMLANDSGALLLMVGALLCALGVGVAWATHERVEKVAPLR